MGLATYVSCHQVRIRSLLSKAVLLTSIAIVVFFISLLSAGTRLLEVEKVLESDVTEDMSWTILQAQIESHRFLRTLSKYVNAYPSVERKDVQMRYDILGSRLSLMTSGQPRRHLEMVGVYDLLRENIETYYVTESILSRLMPGDRQAEHHIVHTLEPLNAVLRDIANKSLTSSRAWKAEQRLQHRDYTIDTLLYMSGTLVSGFALIALLVRGRQEIASAHKSTQREREMTDVYRNLVSIVSHQLRTPLAIIDSSAQRLKRRAGSIGADEVSTRADYIRQATNGLLMLMDTILDAARHDTGEIHFRPRGTELQSLIIKLCSRIREANNGCVIDVNVELLPSDVVCDPILIEQALSNVIENAIKYSDHPTIIQVRAWKEVGTILISVKDNGIGVPQDEVELIFKQFFRGRFAQSTPGTGIGLSFARQIAQLHQGDIGVTSQRGVGSTFTLSFPYTNNTHGVPLVRRRTWV